MEISSIEELLDNITHAKFEKRLSDCKAEHDKLDREIQQLLDKYHDDGKDPASLQRE